MRTPAGSAHPSRREKPRSRRGAAGTRRCPCLTRRDVLRPLPDAYKDVIRSHLWQFPVPALRRALRLTRRGLKPGQVRRALVSDVAYCVRHRVGGVEWSAMPAKARKAYDPTQAASCITYWSDKIGPKYQHGGVSIGQVYQWKAYNVASRAAICVLLREVIDLKSRGIYTMMPARRLVMFADAVRAVIERLPDEGLKQLIETIRRGEYKMDPLAAALPERARLGINASRTAVGVWGDRGVSWPWNELYRADHDYLCAKAWLSQHHVEALAVNILVDRKKMPHKRPPKPKPRGFGFA